MVFAPSLAISTAPLRRIYSPGTGGLSSLSQPMSSLSKIQSEALRWRRKLLQGGILRETYFPLHLRVWQGRTERLSRPASPKCWPHSGFSCAYQSLVHRKMGLGLALTIEEIVPKVPNPHPFTIAINRPSGSQAPSLQPRQEVTTGRKGTQTLLCDTLSP